jgi:PAS domain S-box-containing protein
LLVVVCAALVWSLGIFAYRSLSTLSEGTEFAANAQAGRFHLAQVLQLLVQMGAGGRNFLATGDPAAFADAQAAARTLPSELESLQAALAGDVAQRPLLAQLMDLARQRELQSQEVIDRARQHDVAGVTALVASGTGGRIIEAARLVVDQMQARQKQRLDARLALVAEAQRTVVFAIGATATLATLLLIFVAYVTTRQNARLQRAQEELSASEARLREANANLERRIAERSAQLLAREVLIRTFYEHSSECHAVLAEVAEGVFRYEEINPATLRLYGKERTEVIGKTIDEVLGPRAAALLNGYLVSCLRSGAPCRYERHQGEEVIEAVATPVPLEAGMERRIVVSARDVTERRRLEQQLLQSQKMEAVGQLTGGLAHDFNNLLTGISGSLELMQNRVAQGRISELDRYLNAAQGAIRRAAALTHRLLAFSRRQTLDAKPTDVNRLIAEMVEFIRRTVGPEITVEIAGSRDLWNPSVDANQLENALLNLCINARDAMPKGGRITIETANRWIDERFAQDQELTPGQYISICVRDTGCGMSPEVVARAFDPFFTTKPLGQGTGLGLSMIYGFARQSGGHARIYSELGKGALVCIYLPRYQGEASPVTASLASPTSTPAGDGETVLVVDDEEVLRMLITEVLRDLRYQTIECSDGVAALKVLETNQRIDLLVTDVGLPNGINGRQLADAAKKLRPSLPVLFITGYAENAVLGHGHIEEGLEVLTKPFEMEVLARRISSLMKGTRGDAGRAAPL